MDVIQICRQLRPGTSWVCNYDVNGNYYDLRQADDDTPRVTVPTPDEINQAASEVVNP